MTLGSTAYYIYTRVKVTTLSVVGGKSYFQSSGEGLDLSDLAQSFITSMLAVRRSKLFLLQSSDPRVDRRNLVLSFPYPS